MAGKTSVGECRRGLVYSLLIALGSLPIVSATVPADDGPLVKAHQTQAAETYERDLRQAVQQHQKLVQAFQTLLNQDQALHAQIVSTAQTAERQLQESNRMAEMSNLGGRTVQAANAMQLASMLPQLNAALWTTNAALAKVATDGQANQQLYRSLADPFGRRSAAEAEPAIEIMNDALLFDPNDDEARLVLALAQIRLGRFKVAEGHLSALADEPGACQCVALAARGHMRSVGWLGLDKTIVRQGTVDLSRAMAFKPRQAEACLYRALVNWHAEKWSQVESDLQAALKLRPDDVDGLRLLAWFYATSPGTDKRLANAESAAKRACDLTAQQDAACLESLAAVRARQVNWDGAVEAQCQAVALASGDGAVSRLAAYREKLLPEKGSYLTITELAPAPIPPAEQETAKSLEWLRQRPAPGIELNLQYRGRLLAVCRKWGPAAANLALVSQSPSVEDEWRRTPNRSVNPADVPQSRSASEDWIELGCLLWLSGDKAGYQSLCQRAMTVNATQAIRLMSVTPDSGILPATAMAGWARMGNAAEFRERTHINALAHYRAGRYDDARAMLNQPLPFQLVVGPNNGPWEQEGIGLKWQLCALIDAREGRFDQAKVAADQARLLVPHNLPMGAELSSGLLGIWLEYQVLQVELQGLFDTSTR